LGRQLGQRNGGSPARIASYIAQQAAELASGPMESSVKESGNAPSRGTTPRRRLESRDAAQRRALADRAARVGAERHHAHAVGLSHRAPEDEPPGTRPVFLS